MQMYKYAIFDMDGTLLDSLKDLRNAVNFVMEKHGHPVHSLEAVRKMVGNGNRRLMERALPDGAADPDFETKFSEFKTFYLDHCKDETGPYDGIMEMLEALNKKGVKSAIVSNKYDAAVKEMKDYYFSNLIDGAFGVKPGMNVKPAPDAVFEAMELIKANPDETLYIGDSEVDADTAKNSGLDCVLCTWGFRERSVLEAKEHIALIDHALDLEKFF